MKTEIKHINGAQIALVHSDKKLITDAQSALDFIMTVQYETGCRRIAIHKAAVTEDFFVLSTRLAGDVLQKLINYNIKLAIIGDYSTYTSAPLKALITESNRGKDVFFLETEQEAFARLGAV